jgi:hypothetical protein
MLGRANAGCRGILHVGTRLQVFPLVPSCHTKCTTLDLSSSTLVSDIFTYLSAGSPLAMSLVVCRFFNARLELDPHSLITCSASEAIRSLDMYRPALGDTGERKHLPAQRSSVGQESWRLIS